MADAAKTYNEHAASWSKRLEEGNNPAHRFLEKPAMRALLGDSSGKKALALGCGSGEETDLLLAAGCESVTGIDVSDKLIALAKASWPSQEFRVGDCEDLGQFDDASFDLVYSSLVLHYLPDWGRVLAETYRVLKPGGRFIFSTHHPVKWGMDTQRGDPVDSFDLRYCKNKNTGEFSVVGDYLTKRELKDTWFGSMQVSYWHRSMQDMLRDVLASKFKLEDFIEPAAVEEAKEANPQFYGIHTKIPLFVLFSLRKTG